ncbi:MAG: SprB repeat-containing protein [Cyclobacteriaceae bacterium]|jgi:hypothetical protein|nr:SprB repeat-containing protein [Cyclobacteriaceae bacterium]
MKHIPNRILALLFLLSAWGYIGCSSNDEPVRIDCATVSITVAVAGTTNPTSCAVSNGSITVAPTGGEEPYTYNLNNTSTFQSGATFSNLASGIYTVTVRDRNGCTGTISNIVLAAPNAPEATANAIVADASCDNDTGSVTINATGGTGTLSYSRNGTTFQASNVFQNLRAGSYTFTVRDENNCVTTLTVAVPNATGVTFNGSIRALFQNNCGGGGCHPSRGDLFTYDAARLRAASIKSRTQSGNMPPNASLTQAQISQIACWVDHGTPEE